MDLWCDQRLIVRVNGPDHCQQVTTCGPFARVGSHPDSDIILPGIAKRLLYLHATVAGVYCLDLREHAAAKSEQSGRWIRGEASITVEGYSLNVRLKSNASNNSGMPLSLLSRNLLPRPSLAFRVTCKGGLKAKYKIHRALTVVGRDTTCGLNLSGTKVSSPHCVLYYDRGQIWCIDLLSNNGTLLNGQRCVVAQVQPGDRLTVGEFRLVHCGQIAANAASAQVVSDWESFSNAHAEGATGARNVESQSLERNEPSTVELSKGDTVNMKLSEKSPTGRGKPQDNDSRVITRHATRKAGSSVVPPKKDGGLSPHYKVSEADSTEILPSASLEPMDGASPLSRQAVDEAMAKLDASESISAQMQDLKQRLREQDKVLAALRDTLAAEQELWRSERDCLRYEMTMQSTVIGDLKRELAFVRAALDRQIIQARGSSQVASVCGEIQENTVVTGRVAVAVSRGSQPVALVQVERRAMRPSEDVVSVAGTRTDRGETTGRLSSHEALIEHATQVEILGGFPSEGRETDESRDGQAAERETIHNVGSVHSTVVWQQFQRAIAIENGPSVDAVNAGEPGTAARELVASGGPAEDGALEVARQASSLLARPAMVDRRQELSQFVNDRLYELEQGRGRFSNLVRAGLALAFVCGGVFASWWFGVF